MSNTGKTAIYCRTALANESRIAAQERLLRAYADERGHADAILYCDDGAAGNTLDHPVLYTKLLLSKTLFPHLRETN